MLGLCNIKEYWKIQLFKRRDLYLNKPVEYTYLGINLINLVSYNLLCGYCFTKNKRLIKEFMYEFLRQFYGSSAQEKPGETPFLCSSDYGYSSKAARFVCQVRTANLICMWLMFLSNSLVTITMYIPDKIYKGIEV
ncbi:hypothetical protein RhiirA4_455754 [Rhizophagus irregularis]|uniref:Uncharacterized protein n=1 Tax=Rhizophagus irregularis TaxID=588596 RepID=A0A2I1G5Y9_9GLOM|nr:hypothetical protein RhiirA4_455754 [Rhizophagus irregularis]